MGRWLHKNERGLSLIELVIAGAISGLLTMLMARLITKPMALVDNVGEALDSRVVFAIRTQELRNRLSRSFPMRRGFYNCGSDPIQQMLQSIDPDDQVAEIEVTQEFTIAHSVHSELVGAGPSRAEIVVPNPLKYPAGSLVLLSAVNNPEFGGVHRVIANPGLVGINPANGQPTDNLITLSEEISLKTPPDSFGCQVPADVQKSLSDFTTSPLNSTFGKTANIYRADVIQLSRYYLTQEADNQILMEDTWPSPGPYTSEFPVPPGPGPPPPPEADPNRMIRTARITPNFESMKFVNSRWELSVGDPDYSPSNTNGRAGIQSNGVFNTQMYITIKSRALADTQSSGRINRSLSQRISYSTSSSGRVNVDAPTSPTSAELEFPTCGITAVRVNDLVERQGKRYARWHRVTGLIGGNVQAGISVELVDGGSGGPTCWNGEVVEFPDGPVGGKIYDGRLAENGDGRNGRATITYSGGLNDLFCDAPPSSSFNAVMSYFHPDLGRMIDVDCSNAETSATPEEFDFAPGQATECEQSTGTITLGTVQNIGVNPPQDGPVIYLGNDSCDWESGPGGWTDCTPHPQGQNGPRGRLERIRPYPTDLPGGNIPNEINCT